MRSGEFSRHIKKANKLYGSRCDYSACLIQRELSEMIEFTKPQGGMALWLRFKKEFPVSQVISKASSMGLQLLGSSYTKGKDMSGIRFGFASVNEADIDFAIEVFKKISLR